MSCFIVRRPSGDRQMLYGRGSYSVPTCALLGGSKTTVTRRFPQAGHMRRDSSRERGKLGPRVATSDSTL